MERSDYHSALIFALWCALAVYLVTTARNIKPVVRRESLVSRLSHVLPLAVGAWMVATPKIPHGWLSGRFGCDPRLGYWAGVIILAAGIGFAAWGRHALGGNWSGTVTLKAGHEVIDSGPYRVVRHPIYTGILLGYLGVATARGEWRGLVACALAFAALWHKLRLEERWMVDAFGDVYREYQCRVSALIPFVL